MILFVSKMIFPLVFCLAILPLALGGKIHERMTTREVEEIFQTTPDAVPDYEVVQLHVSKVVKRASGSARALKFNAFGGNLKLWLHPTEGILAGKNTPVFTAKKNAKGKIEFNVYPNAMNNVGELLEDPAAKASVVVNKDSKGRRTINGHIATRKLVVRSLPESISDDLFEQSSSRNTTSEKLKTTRSAYHVVFKREDKRIKEIYNSARLNETRNRVRRASEPPKPVIPEVLYPEIMVIVDSTLMAVHCNNIDKVLAYVVTFWNGVDLLYRGFEDPKFRFNIARVIVAQDKNALPYISDNMFNTKMFSAYDAIEDAARFYFDVLHEFSESSYDTAVTLTRLDMSDDGEDSDMLGIMPKQGSACVVKRDKRYVMKVAIITDSGSFDGVHTTAHEFAHLLGSGHDEWFTCKPKDGYIMSSKEEHTENSHDFSDCTVDDIQQWLKDGEGLCLYNVPTTTDPLPRILPGRLSSRDHQCKMLEKGNSCYSEAKKHLPCTVIYCLDPKDAKKCVEHEEYGPADGAFCSVGKVCLHGQCLKLN